MYTSQHDYCEKWVLVNPFISEVPKMSSYFGKIFVLEEEMFICISMNVDPPDMQPAGLPEQPGCGE